MNPFENTLAPQPYQTATRWYDRTTQQGTPVTNLFFQPANIQYLKQQLEAILKQLTGGQCINVPVNAEFMQSMTTIAFNNPVFAYLGNDGLQQLNNMFLEWEARIQYVSLRHGKLFNKYFIEADRMRVFPHGVGEKVTKGEVKIAPSGYMLSNPWRKQYGNFLSDVLAVEEQKKPCTRLHAPPDRT